jgi:hypothetical protein
MAYNSWKGPVTQRKFEELDDIEFTAFQHEALQQAHTLAARYASQSPEYLMEIAKQFSSLARKNLEGKQPPKKREYEQPRDEETGRFQGSEERGQLPGSGPQSKTPSLYESKDPLTIFEATPRSRKVEW